MRFLRRALLRVPLVHRPLNLSARASMERSVRLGLDLQGGTQVILVPQPVVEGTEITDEQLATCGNRLAKGKQRRRSAEK